MEMLFCVLRNPESEEHLQKFSPLAMLLCTDVCGLRTNYLDYPGDLE